LQFRGVGEYLEDLVARIDAPLLDDLAITFFHQLIFDTPQLAQFISHTPKFEARNEAHVVFSNRDAQVSVKLLNPIQPDGALFKMGISCRQSDWQLSSLAQVCGLSLPHALIPGVEHLAILGDKFPRPHYWQDDIESGQWLELFRPFTAVKDLYISPGFASRIAPALQVLAKERLTEVLPALQTLFLAKPLPSGPVREAIMQFVAMRQLVGHPIAVSYWEKEQDWPYGGPDDTDEEEDEGSYETDDD
jgi:hypothetical protein